MGLDLFVKKLVYGGYGLGEDRGKKFFVRYAAPKELVEVEVVKEKKDYTEAVVKTVKIGSQWRRNSSLQVLHPLRWLSVAAHRVSRTAQGKGGHTLRILGEDRKDKTGLC
jgi:23S rRNA (uracil-5-)-methyltransferase RumA (EC 2.1.1.-)